MSDEKENLIECEWCHKKVPYKDSIRGSWGGKWNRPEQYGWFCSKGCELSLASWWDYRTGN